MIEPKIIRDKALELNYEDCGIIGIHEVDDYLEKLNERINLFPETQEILERNKRFIHLNDKFPWAKSIIVCTRKYGKYYIPDNLNGLIGKYYLVDSRTNKQSNDYKDSVEFNDFLKSLGFQTATDILYGITALRWAAYKSGLGTIRNNNFLYTNKSGSWVYIEAWLIDEDITLKQTYEYKKCPENCNKCIQACPTKSLNMPYAMDRTICINYLTTRDSESIINNKHNKNIGKWIYGCDVCQDVCPFNSNKWEKNEDFPELNELSELISLEKIINMGDVFLENVMSERFWYIKKEEAYKWKINILNAIFNNYNDSYLPYINMACNDKNKKVQSVAKRIKEKIMVNKESYAK
jgi:epoxyqueuosine reductase